MSARWFLGRSALWFSSRNGCSDLKVAVGRLLKEQQNSDIDWMFITGIGRGVGYWREAYRDLKCSAAREAYRFYANQLTRPYDDSPDRAAGLRRDEGYYLELMDWGRSGPPAVRRDGQAVVAGGEVYVDKRRASIDGRPGLRLTYWMLYGMDQPRGNGGRVQPALTHEGDWERVDVLLRAGDAENEWDPVSLRLYDPDGSWRALPWGASRRVAGPGSNSATHPVLYAARASHTPYSRPGRFKRRIENAGRAPVAVVDIASGSCPQCPRWRTWERLLDASQQEWYGFGGAWGDVGVTDSTSGPLGPHGSTWPVGDAAAQIEWAKQQHH